MALRRYSVQQLVCVYLGLARGVIRDFQGGRISLAGAKMLGNLYLHGEEFQVLGYWVRRELLG